MSLLIPTKPLMGALGVSLIVTFFAYRVLPPGSSSSENAGSGSGNYYYTGDSTLMKRLPANAKATCGFDSTSFAALFASGAITKDGLVKPPNSLTFGGILDPNCRFYTWAEQMFLWTTSRKTGNSTSCCDRVFDSPMFYDVSPPDSANQRTLIPHDTATVHAMSVFSRLKGAHSLPIVMSRSGAIMEVLPPVISPITGKQLLLGAGGDTVEVAKAVRVAGAGAVRGKILDRTGRNILGARPMIPAAFKDQDVVQRVDLEDGHSIFLTATGEVLDVNTGEADNSILLTQQGSMVYYSIMVNDVYAYLLTGLKTGAFLPNPDMYGRRIEHFPTNTADLAQITGLARANGVTLPDSNALALVLKASWVDAATLTDPHNYVCAMATVPVYNRDSNNIWTYTGTETKKLAMVGLHVVGSTANHPEMIWATFEHYKNTPSAGYNYVDSTNTVVTMPRNIGLGNWLFCTDSATGSFNQRHQHMSGTSVVADAPFSISPSNTIRWKPFGNAADFFPSSEDPSVAYANTKIIAMNNSVHRLLKKGDVRANYNFLGATWTFDGSAGNASNGAGTKRLSNTTMETYQQGNDTLYANSGTCFSCHGGELAASSHIYTATQPLSTTSSLVARVVNSKIAAALADSRANDQITLYPNPVRDLLTATIVTGVTGNSKILICDMQGRTVLQQQILIQNKNTSVQMAVGGLAPGMYLLKLYNANGKIVPAGKFIKL